MPDGPALAVARGADAVDVWTVREDAPDVPARLDRYARLLPPDERERADRFVQPGDRARFVIGRVLARTMLSAAAPIAPQAWRIVVDAHGRPHLAGAPSGVPDLRFNLTHTEGLVACAVTISRDVGVDVERVTRRLSHEGIPERFFSAAEVADLRRLPPGEQERVFFDYWTLKEAYIKARGLGLALPLGQFTFRRAPGAPPRIEFAPELHDDPASWQFAQFWPTEVHRMAVAVRRHGADLPIHVRDVVPEAPA